MARLPIYLRALTTLIDQGVATCSSNELAEQAGVNPAKLRKDLSYLGSYGTRGVGYDVEYLRYQIAREIGQTQDWDVVIVGVGNLGSALSAYQGFSTRGIRVAALVDSDPSRVGTVVSGITVTSLDDLDAVVAERGVSIGIIATPGEAAQPVADRLVAAGITSILNFAPAVVQVPDGVDLRKVDLSIELQILAYHEQRKTHPTERRGGDRMSVLMVGMSHKSAPIEVLERASLDVDAAVKLSHRVLETPAVSESVVISTCNRVEVYVEADRFHGSVEEVSRLLAEHAGLDRDELVQHVYVHYDDAAVAHLFSVTSGLDSMILGESQILGQVRDALHGAQAESTVGPALNALFQQALRIGKRGHNETGIDRLAPSIVTAGLAVAGDAVAAADSRFLVAGAGTMANLAVRTLIDRGVAPHHIMVANRTYQSAFALVATHGVSAVRWDSLDVELAAADVVISCTGASGTVFDRDRIERATAGGRGMTLIDLALPRDVDPAVAELARRAAGGHLDAGRARFGELVVSRRRAGPLDRRGRGPVVPRREVRLPRDAHRRGVAHHGHRRRGRGARPARVAHR